MRKNAGMKRMTGMCNLRDKTVKAMPYDVRCRRYNEEKQEVLRENPGIGGAELDEILYRLRKKWRI